MQFLYFLPLLAPLTRTCLFICTPLVQSAPFESRLLKLFQLITFSLFPTACTWSTMLPNTTAGPDTCIHAVPGQFALRQIWRAEDIPVYKVVSAAVSRRVAAHSCELAEILLEICVPSHWRRRESKDEEAFSAVGRRANAETMHTLFSHLASINESEFIYNSQHWERWLLQPGSALLLEIRAKPHAWKN